jgi:putative hydrolase of the HAD superfamily
MRPKDERSMRSLTPLLPLPTGQTPSGLAKLGREKVLLIDVYGTLVISAAGDQPSAGDDGSQDLILGLLKRFGILATPDQVWARLQEAIEKEHTNLRRQGIEYPEIDILEIWRSVLGMDDPGQLKAFAREYEMATNPVYPMPGLVEMLQSCRKRGLVLGIVSNAQFYTADLLELLLEDSLDACGFDPQLTLFSYQFRRAKPSVYMFDIAVRRLRDRGISPASILYVGNDMRNDIIPARAVGFQTALFAGDRRSLRWRRDDACCRDVSPDVVITDLRQLIPDGSN